MSSETPGDAVRDPARLAELRSLDLLDTPREEAFDCFTRLAARFLDVPVALFTLVEHDRQFIKSQVGLSEPLASKRETPLSHSFCQHAVASGKPLIIEDAREDPRVRDNPAVPEFGVIAYAGIPLTTPDGHTLGSFCAIDSKPHHWTEDEIGVLQDLAAGLMTEVRLRGDISHRARAEALLASEKRVLEAISQGRPLPEVLELLVLEIERQSGDAPCSVLLVDPATQTLRVGAAPNVPEPVNRRVDGLPVGEGQGSCGTAAYRNEPVIVSDASDPLWADYRELALEHGLAASWSQPIRGGNGEVLGTFAIYYREAREPTAPEREVVERAAHLAAIAIERSRRDQELHIRDRALAAIREGVLITDAHREDDPVVYCNPAFERLTGHPPGATLGRNCRFLQGPDTDRATVGRIREAMAGGQPFRGEILNYRSDGTPFWNLLSITPVHDPEGGVTHFVGVQQDVTDRKQTLAELQAAEAHYRRVVETSPMGIYVVDRDGRITEANAALAGILGSSVAGLLGRHFSEFLAPDDAERAAGLFRERMAGRLGEASVEIRLLRPSGEIRQVEMCSTVVDEDGAIVGTHGIVRDVTDEREREQWMRFLAAAVEALNESVSVVDAEGNLVYANPAHRRMLGYETGTLPRPYADFLPDEESREQLTEVMEQVRMHASWSGTVRRRHAAGHTIWAEARVQRVRKDDRELFFAVSRDITGERELQARMRLFTTALESLAEGVSVVDASGRFLYTNAAYCRALGYEPGCIPEGSVWDFVPDEESRRQVHEIGEQVRSHGAWSGRVQRRRRDGRIIPMEVLAQRVEHDAQHLYFTISHDITEELEREQRLRRAERLASVGTLVSGVAHELNNPLSAVRGFAELLLTDETSPERREDLQTIRRETERMAKIVSDLRILARQTQEGPEESSHAQVDLNDVVRHVVRTREYALSTRGIEVRLDLAPDLPPVLGDRARLEQVMLNLAVNAEQAMDPWPGERRLTLRTRASDRGASVHVVDTGPGIPQQHLDRIFDPFFTTKAPGEGTGLGLSLVHGIVAEHRGEIHVESQVGSGTAFRIDLPRAAEAPAEPIEREPATAPPRPLRVLVVDDEPANRRVISRFLQRRGHQVDEAAEGGEALRLMAGAEYDVIVSDLQMPGMRGDELLAHLREKGGGLDRRLILLTGDTASPAAVRVLEAADVPVLAKPLQLQGLAAEVERLGRA